MMRGAQLAVGQAWALSAEDDTRLAVGHVRLDLLERTAGEEWRGSAGEGDQAAVGEPGGDAHEVLFGDPDIDHPVRNGP